MRHYRAGKCICGFCEECIANHVEELVLSEIRDALDHIAAMCGNPDPAEACRLILEKIEEYSLQEIAHFTTNWEYPYETLEGMTGLFEGNMNVGMQWAPEGYNG